MNGILPFDFYAGVVLVFPQTTAKGGGFRQTVKFAAFLVRTPPTVSRAIMQISVKYAGPQQHAR